MDTTRLTAPVALITGASHGIGRETAALLALNGFRVFGTSRNSENVPPIPGVTLLNLDVQSQGSIRSCVEDVIASAGQIDVLINNAGMVGPGSASEELDIQRVRDLFETNFFGAVQVTNAVLPYMRERGRGTVINISSASGLVALPPFFTFYAASKHALEAYTEGLRYEVAPFGITVVAVEPGYTDTGIIDSVEDPDHPIAAYSKARMATTLLNRAGIRYGSRPERTARTVLRVLRQEHPALRHPTGFDALAIGWLRRFTPAPLFEALGRWMFLTWKPRMTQDETAHEPGMQDIPTPNELGLHRILFHGPTLNRTIQLGFGLAGLVTAAAALKFIARSQAHHAVTSGLFRHIQRSVGAVNQRLE